MNDPPRRGMGPLFVESSLGGATPLVSPPMDLSRAVVAFYVEKTLELNGTTCKS